MYSIHADCYMDAVLAKNSIAVSIDLLKPKCGVLHATRALSNLFKLRRDIIIYLVTWRITFLRMGAY